MANQNGAVAELLKNSVTEGDEFVSAHSGGLAYIYGLVDPRDGRTRYIGKANDPYVRYSQHIREKEDFPKCRWIRKLLALSLKPVLVILQKVTSANWKQAEQFQIKLFRERGMADLNATDGGDGVIGYERTEEQRAHYAAAARKRFEDPEQRRHLSEINTGKKHTPESRKKISEVGMGRVVSAETRRKKSEMYKGRPIGEEQKKKISDTMKARGIVPSEEMQRRAADAVRGKPKSEEQKRKMSETRRLRWANDPEYGKRIAESKSKKLR